MNKSIVWIVLIVILGAGAFFGGIKYQQGQQSSIRQFGGNFTGGQGSSRLGGRARTGADGGQIMGEILNQDAGSITVKLQDGSSKIVILSDKTSINKATTGSKLDLTMGERVVVFGTTNTDGSVTAQMIQINPLSVRGPNNNNSSVGSNVR